MAVSPFEFVNAINGSKEDLFETRGYSASDYNAFIINRQFSYFPDTIFIANAANQLSNAPSKSQFDFYRFLVDPRRRYAKWGKPVKHEYLEILMKTYEISLNKALDIIDLFSKEELEELSEICYGGKQRPAGDPSRMPRPISEDP